MSAHRPLRLPHPVTARLYAQAVDDAAMAWLHCLDLARQLHGNAGADIATHDVDARARALALEALHRAETSPPDAPHAITVTPHPRLLFVSESDRSQK